MSSIEPVEVAEETAERGDGDSLPVQVVVPIQEEELEEGELPITS